MVVKWEENMSVGDATIDRQHKEIINFLSQLSKDVEKGADLRQIRATIDTLTRYIKQHFAYEEELMKKEHDIRLKEHKKVHEEFVRVYQTFEADFNVMYHKPNLSSRALTVLLKDLVNHFESNYLQHMLKDRKFHGEGGR